MKVDKRLLQQTNSVRAYLAQSVLFSLGQGLATIALAYMLAHIIAQVFLGGAGLAELGGWLAAFVAVAAARAGLVGASDLAANRSAAQVKTSLRHRLYSHVFRLGPTYTRQERSGELANTLNEGVESLDAYFSQYLPQLFVAGLVPLAVLATVWATDMLSGVVLLLTAPLLPLFMILIGKKAESLTKKQWRTLSLLNAHFLDVLQGLTTLKAFGRAAHQEATITRVSDQFRRATLSVLKVAFLSALVLEMGATLSTAVIAVEIGLRLMYAQISFEAALFVLLLAPEFYLPLRMLGAKFHAGMVGTEAANRIFQILEIPPNVAEPTVPAQLTNLAQATISFNRVTYTYPEADAPSLTEISFQIPAGQKTALVGPSGAGKTTIAALLLGLAEAQGGEITLADQPYRAADWRGQLAWVSQRPYLFNTSVADNIRLGRPEASLDEVKEAARLAYAAEFIEKFPQSYDTVIGERGLRLSAGQAQRISLARAFLMNAPFLILDEATSSLDPETEKLVLDATNRLMTGRTTLMIAHRLSTVSLADQIIVLQNGQIMQRGQHSSLLEQAGLYRELVRAGTTLTLTH